MAGSSRREIVLTIIRTQPITYSKLCDMLDLSHISIRNALLTLESKGLIISKERYNPGKRSHNRYFEYYVSPTVDWCRFCDGDLTEEDNQVYCTVCGEPDPALTESSGMDWGRRNEVHLVSKGSD